MTLGDPADEGEDEAVFVTFFDGLVMFAVCPVEVIAVGLRGCVAH